MQATVDELIMEGGNWNVEMLQSTFRQVDVEAILAIPLGVSDQDLLPWHFEKHGSNSVRTGYKILRLGLIFGIEASSSGSLLFTPANWNFVWKESVPRKVCLFTWRACRNLPQHGPTYLAEGHCVVAVVRGVIPRGRTSYIHCWVVTLRDWSGPYHTFRGSISCDHEDPELWFWSLHRNLDKSLTAVPFSSVGCFGWHEINYFLRM
ncbi:UNVERIFIED_CONTAM: hypothetical protein Slati_3909900 [Sesamum latifolium]|uniref:Reverse transcriptase zinc-binding domain-containing protein n=1 Tax=Sesamum latifolium TaxID=2727402 RepID=A0AAW2TNH1_9LAMI